MWPVSTRMRFLQPQSRPGPPRSPRRRAAGPAPVDVEARARSRDRVFRRQPQPPSWHGPVGRPIDWSAIWVVGAVVLGVAVLTWGLIWAMAGAP